MKVSELKSLIRECIHEIKEEEVSSPPDASGLLNGQSNQVAASRVNKLLAAISKGFFSDESWEGINKIFSKLKEAGIEFDLLGAKYGGQADSNTGMPTYKEWQISIPFVNNKGKQIELIGQITAHGAGTVEDPLSRYDITAYVTPVAKRNTMSESSTKDTPEKTETYELPDLRLPGTGRAGGLMIVDYFPNEVKVRYWQSLGMNRQHESESDTIPIAAFNQSVAPLLKQKKLVDTTFYDPQTGKVVKTGTSENLDSKPSPISSDEPYGVMDTQTKKIVYKTTYTNRNRARRYAEKANLEYGAHKFQPVVLKHHGMTEEWEPYDAETDSFGYAPEPRMDKIGTGNKQDTSVDSDLDKWLMGLQNDREMKKAGSKFV